MSQWLREFHSQVFLVYFESDEYPSQSWIASTQSEYIYESIDLSLADSYAGPIWTKFLDSEFTFLLAEFAKILFLT